MYWSFLEGLLPNETYYIENIKSTNFIEIILLERTLAIFFDIY
jgi:hypothetical protein